MSYNSDGHGFADHRALGWERARSNTGTREFTQQQSNTRRSRQTEPISQGALVSGWRRSVGVSGLKNNATTTIPRPPAPPPRAQHDQLAFTTLACIRHIPRQATHTKFNQHPNLSRVSLSPSQLFPHPRRHDSHPVVPSSPFFSLQSSSCRGGNSPRGTRGRRGKADGTARCFPVVQAQPVHGVLALQDFVQKMSPRLAHLSRYQADRSNSKRRRERGRGGGRERRREGGGGGWVRFSSRHCCCCCLLATQQPMDL